MTMAEMARAAFPYRSPIKPEFVTKPNLWIGASISMATKMDMTITDMPNQMADTPARNEFSSSVP